MQLITMRKLRAILHVLFAKDIIVITRYKDCYYDNSKCDPLYRLDIGHRLVEEQEKRLEQLIETEAAVISAYEIINNPGGKLDG